MNDKNNIEIAEGFKKKEVGVIPSDWEVRTINDVAPLQRGFDLPSSNLIRGKFPVVYSNGIINHHHKFKVKGPGVVTGRSGTIGNVHYIKNDFWPHNTTLWVTNFNGNDPLYIYYLYSSLRFDKFSTGSGVPTLNRNDLHDCLILLPATKTEQTAIAAALSDMDALIDAQEKLIEKKRRIKQGAMQELLKPKNSWKEYSFNQIFKKNATKKYQIKSDAYQSSGKYPVVDQGKKKIIGYSEYSSKLFKCPKQGVIIFGDHTRIIKFIDFNFIIGADGTQLLVVNNDFSTLYLYQYLLLNKVPNTGYNRHFSFLKKMPYILPDYSAQNRIAQILSDMDAEIEKLENQLPKYKMLKIGMMQELLTGKKRIVKRIMNCEL